MFEGWGGQGVGEPHPAKARQVVNVSFGFSLQGVGLGLAKHIEQKRITHKI